MSTDQGVSQILSSSASTYWGAAFAGVFDASVLKVSEGTSPDGDDWCFIDGLDAKHKILLDLLAPAMILCFMVTVFIFSRYIFQKPLEFGHKAVNFQTAELAVFLFIVGKVLDTLFKLMACQSIGSEEVHFYFGYEQCNGMTWYIAMICLLALIMSFGAVFFFGRKLTVNERADRNRFIFKVCERFQPEYWYWEYVIFWRRIMIAFFAVGVTNLIYKLVFLFSLMVFIWIQWNTRPFLTSEANQVLFSEM